MRWRDLLLLSGAIVIAAGLALSDGSLPVHMAGHGLVVAVGVPLLVLGRPIGFLLRSLPQSWARGLARLLRSRAAAVLLNPAVAWVAFVGTQLVFHITPLFDAARHDELVHALEHGIFLFTAICFWEVALAVEPLPVRLAAPWRALYLWAAMPVADLCGAWLIGSGRPAAGGVMIVSMMPLGIAAVAIAWSWMLGEERTEEAAHGAS